MDYSFTPRSFNRGVVVETLDYQCDAIAREYPLKARYSQLFFVCLHCLLEGTDICKLAFAIYSVARNLGNFSSQPG